MLVPEGTVPQKQLQDLQKEATIQNFKDTEDFESVNSNALLGAVIHKYHFRG
jgi:hypothetical protein